jgi:hypothetical protein
MDEMDQADQELRQAIGRSWPFTKRDGKLDLLVPPPGETGPNKLTVGKIFGGMLILENWKLTRFGTTILSTHKCLPVSFYCYEFFHTSWATQHCSGFLLSALSLCLFVSMSLYLCLSN